MPLLTAAGAALVLLLLGLLYLCWLLVQPFLDVLLWATVLVMVFMPVHRRIIVRTGNRTASAVLSTILVVGVILVPATFVVLAVVRELGGLISSAGTGALYTTRLHQVIERVQTVLPWVDLHQIESPEFLVDHLQAWSSAFANRTFGMVSSMVSAVVEIFLVIFTMFYVFRDGDAILHAMYDMLPLERHQSRAVYARMLEVISASVYGVLLVAFIQGMLGGFIFWALGMPSPLLWGVVMFFLSIIPMAGSFLVWAPATVLLAVSGAWGKALLLVLWGVFVVGSVDNVLSPRLVGKRARLHELLIFFSVLGGLNVFGVIGIVLGPVTVAVTLAVLDVVRRVEQVADNDGTASALASTAVVGDEP